MIHGEVSLNTGEAVERIRNRYDSCQILVPEFVGYRCMSLKRG